MPRDYQAKQASEIG